MNSQLTPEQAVDVLDQVANKYAGTRQEHQILIEAIKLLREVVTTGPKGGVTAE